jgi:hypothetical protein
MNVNINLIKEKQKNRFTKEIEQTISMATTYITETDALFTEQEKQRLGMVNIILEKGKSQYSGTVDSWESNGKIHAEIRLELTTLYDTISTLAHEFIHVKQHVTGRFQPIDPNTVIWEGDKYTVENRHFKDIMSSLELPWEKEAHRYEGILAGRFFADLSGLNESELVNGFEKMKNPLDSHSISM